MGVVRYLGQYVDRLVTVTLWGTVWHTVPQMRVAKHRSTVFSIDARRRRANVYCTSGFDNHWWTRQIRCSLTAACPFWNHVPVDFKRGQVPKIH
jgi:hypothetical protein